MKPKKKMKKIYVELFHIKNVYILLVCLFVSGNSEEQLALRGFLCLSTGQLDVIDVGSCAGKYLEAKDGLWIRKLIRLLFCGLNHLFSTVSC